MKGPICGLSQQAAEAEGSLILGTQVRVASSSDNDGTGRHCQTARVRQARREGTRMQKPVVEPPQALHRLQPGGYGPGRSARRFRPLGTTTPTPVFNGRPGGSGEGLRRNRSEAAGEELGAYPVNGCAVNTGTIPTPPSSPPNRSGSGQARRRPVAPGWGGGSVVVRGRESRLHGEGSQQISRVANGMPGGRR